MGDDGQIQQAHAWNVIQAFFDKHGLVNQQINSFNHFLKSSAQSVVDEIGDETGSITINP